MSIVANTLVDLIKNLKAFAGILVVRKFLFLNLYKNIVFLLSKDAVFAKLKRKKEQIIKLLMICMAPVIHFYK